MTKNSHVNKNLWKHYFIHSSAPLSLSLPISGTRLLLCCNKLDFPTILLLAILCFTWFDVLPLRSTIPFDPTKVLPNVIKLARGGERANLGPPMNVGERETASVTGFVSRDLVTPPADGSNLKLPSEDVSPPNENAALETLLPKTTAGSEDSVFFASGGLVTPPADGSNLKLPSEDVSPPNENAAFETLFPKTTAGSEE